MRTKIWNHSSYSCLKVNGLISTLKVKKWRKVVGCGIKGANVFSGSSHLNLDNKHRMTFPSRYRELLMEHCYGKSLVR